MKCTECGWNGKGVKLKNPMEPAHYEDRICLDCWEGKVEEKIDELKAEIEQLVEEASANGIELLTYTRQ